MGGLFLLVRRFFFLLAGNDGQKKNEHSNDDCQNEVVGDDISCYPIYKGAEALYAVFGVAELFVLFDRICLIIVS